MCSMLTEYVNIFYYIIFFSMQQKMLTDYVNMEQMKNAIVSVLNQLLKEKPWLDLKNR